MCGNLRYVPLVLQRTVLVNVSVVISSVVMQITRYDTTTNPWSVVVVTEPPFDVDFVILDVPIIQQRTVFQIVRDDPAVQTSFSSRQASISLPSSAGVVVLPLLQSSASGGLAVERPYDANNGAQTTVDLFCD